MIAPLSWAGAIVLVGSFGAIGATSPRRIPRWPLAVGVLMAAAIAYQQTAVAETSAFFFAMLAGARSCSAATPSSSSARSPRSPCAWLTAAIITAGAGKVAFALAGFYVSYTKKALPTSAAGGVRAFRASPVGAALLIAAGAIAEPSPPASRLGARALGRRHPGGHRGRRAAVSRTSWSRRSRRSRCSSPASGALAEPVPRRRPALARRSGPADRRPGDRDPDGEGRRASTGCRSRRRRPTRTPSAITTGALSSPHSTRPGGRSGSTTSTTGSPATRTSLAGSRPGGSAATPPSSGPMTRGSTRSQTCRSTCQLRRSTTTRSCSGTAARSSSTWRSSARC